jgi:hypothetical protein
MHLIFLLRNAIVETINQISLEIQTSISYYQIYDVMFVSLDVCVSMSSYDYYLTT